MGIRDQSIKRKTTAGIMLTSVAGLLLTAVAFTVYDLVTYRQNVAGSLAPTAAILADHSSAALAVRNEKDARAALASLRADPRIDAAALYDRQGNLFVHYPADAPASVFPPVAGEGGYRFEGGRLVMFEPVAEGGVRLGTLYLKSGLHPLYVRLRFYGGVALPILFGSLLVALVISTFLQRRVTRPILALAQVAKTVSERGDYSIRAQKASEDETGLLTDSFNAMLARIEAQTEALRKNEGIRSFLAAIVESSDDAIIGKDLDGRVISWNAGAERMFGYSAAGMLGQPITRLQPPDRPEEEEHILEEVKRGRTRHYETARIRKDGRSLELSLTVSPIRNERGDIIGMSSIARDITDNKLAERLIQESRARLSGIIGSAMDAIISVDAGQRITIFNEAAELMFRCSAGEALGQPLDRFIPARFRKAHHEHVANFGRTGVTGRAMTSLQPLAGLRMDGEEFPIEASISHIEVGGQQIYTVILRDITERKRAEEAVRRQHYLLRTLIDLIPDAIYVRDAKDRFLVANAMHARAMGVRSPEEMLGKTDADFYGATGSAAFRMDDERVLAGETILNKEEVVVFPAVGERQVLTTKVPFKDSNGVVVGLVGVGRDITERKRAEEQILRLNSELEQRVRERTEELTEANKELESFTYSVAHDLRAPLRHIDAFSKLLHEDFEAVLPLEAKHYLKNIRDSTGKMSLLVDDLLNLARVGRQELRRHPTPLSRLVEEVLADLTQEIAGRKFEWHIEPLPAVDCDPGLMKVVFANLLSNAVKYTRPRPVAVIEVGCRTANGDTALFVRDNGVGFDMK